MNRCRWCRASLDHEFDSDVLLHGGVCSECVREEEHRRDEDRGDEDEDEIALGTNGPNGCTCSFGGDCNVPFVPSAASDATSLRRSSSP